MFKIFKQYTATKKTQQITLSAINNLLDINNPAEESASGQMPIELIQQLGKAVAKLVSPNVSGVEVLTTNTSAEHYYSASENAIVFVLQNLSKGIHRLAFVAEFGTGDKVQFVCDIDVSETAAATSGTDERSEYLPVTVGIGDGQGSSVTVDSEITEESENPVTSAAIYAALVGKQPSGTYADGTKYKVGTAAGGAEYAQIEAPCAIGTGVSVSGDQICVGKFNRNDTITDETVVFQVGIGTAPNARKDGFAITAAGNLVLYNNGTPVILTPAKLAQLIS